MNKLIVSLTALCVTAPVFASDYARVDFQNKQRSGSTEHRDVLGLTVGTTLGNAYVEGRLEDEIGHAPVKHEGLAEAKLGLNVLTWNKLTPYVAGAVGYKSKATSNFSYYVVEGGVKYPLLNDLSVSASSRLRSAFGQDTVGGSKAYRTVENSLGVAYKVNAKNTVTGKYAYEHGDVNYHVWGVGYVRAF